MSAIQTIQRIRQLQKLRDSIRQPPPASLTESAGLLEFIPRSQPRYMAPEHLGPLVADLERSWHEPIYRTACAPPRHAKTETVLAFIALTLLRYPERTLAYVSYEAGVSRAKSRKARALALSCGVELADDAQRLNEWRTTAGGGLLATGVGGPLTGHGVDVLLVDDPYKNRVQAESAAYRQMVVDWWGDVGSTRIEPNGSAFIFHTRWHTDDLIGHVLASEDSARWQHIGMPAISDDGEALWPERWPLAALEQKRAAVGPYTWASLYQGTPRPRGGSLFGDVHVADAPVGPTRIAIGIDLAYSAKTHSDYSVAVVLAEHAGTFHVLRVMRMQVEATAFCQALKQLAEDYPLASIAGYVSGTEMGTVQFLRQQTGLEIRALPAKADKFIRAQSTAADWNAGKIAMPADADWAPDFVAELKSFTGVRDKHDDQVDALVGAHDALQVNVGESFNLRNPSRR